MDYNVNKGKFLEMSVTFLGAVGGIVTGSRNLITIKRRDVVKRILVDYGSYQGEDEEFNLTRTLPVPAEEIDFVFVTHSHIDHIGNVPALYRAGYTGNVHGSKETLDQGAEVLRDAAILNAQKMRFKAGEIKKMEKLAEREISRAIKKDVPRKEMMALIAFQEEVEEEKEMVPYLPEDADEAVKHFVPLPVNQEISLCEGIYVKLIPISHINGETMIEIYATHGAERCSIAFSGDIGRDSHPLYKEMTYEEEPEIDFLVLESLHGASDEKETYLDCYKAEEKIMKKAFKNNEKVYLIVFAQDRSALEIEMLNRMRENGMCFRSFFDTPLGQKIFSWYVRSYKAEKSEWFDYERPYPFDIEHIHFVRDYMEHMQYVKMDGPIVGIISSGMGFGGRVVDYFEEHIQDKDAVFVFPEFLPEDCPSKKLCNAEIGELVEINGNIYVKKCTTIQLEGCSGHGYFKEKLKVIKRYPNVKAIMLNHGDRDSIWDLKQTLPQYTEAKILEPEYNDTYDLTKMLEKIKK